MTNGGSRTFVLAAIFVLAGLVGDARAQNNIDFAKLEIQTVKLADNLYVLMGGPAQGNIVASIGSAAVNTHLHGDHRGGNDAMAKIGAVLMDPMQMWTATAPIGIRQRLVEAIGNAPSSNRPHCSSRSKLR